MWDKNGGLDVRLYPWGVFFFVVHEKFYWKNKSFANRKCPFFTAWFTREHMHKHKDEAKGKSKQMKSSLRHKDRLKHKHKHKIMVQA